MENQQEIITPYPQKDISPVVPTPQNQSTIPTFTNVSCNMQIVRLLKAIYAGRYSAFTSFAYDTYGQILFAENNPALSATLAKIVLDDIFQINTLGSAILAFGGNARFTNGQGSPWGARYLNYSSSPSGFLNSIIRNKQQYLALTQSLTKKSTNQSLTSALNQIATITQTHIATLQPFLNNL